VTRAEALAPTDMSVLFSAIDLDCGSIRGVRFELAAGERLCLGGPSGSGKTRLLRAVADLDLHSGDIRLHGRAQCEYPPHEWRRRVAMLPAESAWWAPTVGDHMDGVDAKKLGALGLPDDATRWPVERLSAGEKQRLALLRLTASREPEVLLLDEPTANLDPASVERVEAYLLALARERGVGMLWVTHDAAQIGRVATRALRAADGRLESA
jgi:ABC-type iron transport system FetAB ATPase subunit